MSVKFIGWRCKISNANGLLRRRFTPRSKALLLALLVLGGVTVRAEWSLAGIFGSGMVIPRDVALPVWGRAPAGAPVRVEFAGQCVDGIADVTGRWEVNLAPLEADSQGRSMTVSCPDGEIILENILVGDVFLCAGQSNMQMQLKELEGGEAAIANAAEPLIRMVASGGNATEAQEDMLIVYPHNSRNWLTVSPESVRYFSGLAYLFAQRYVERYQVPVGLIEASEGSSPIRAWIPEAVQRGGAPEFAQTLEDYRTHGERQAAWELKKAAYDAGEGEFPGWFEAYSATPGIFYHARIHPIAPFPVKAVLWYQGENDAIYRHTDVYQAQYGQMAASWRKRFRRPELPFITVQLAPINQPAAAPGESDWAAVRNAQRLAALADERTALVVSTDICEAELHPRRKAELAGRMLDAVSALCMGEEAAYAAPLAVRAEADGERAVVYFDRAAEWVFRDGAATGFEVTGADGRFVAAGAQIDGGRVILSAPGVTPVRVRYAWADHPEGGLFDGNALPASCFDLNVGKSEQ